MNPPFSVQQEPSHVLYSNVTFDELRTGVFSKSRTETQTDSEDGLEGNPKSVTALPTSEHSHSFRRLTSFEDKDETTNNWDGMAGSCYALHHSTYKRATTS
jgi:hypothetical protein